MDFEWQPELANECIRIRPLKLDDLETLYNIASDPLIWEQHPNKDRYKRNVFENFFKGAMESGGAFLVYNASTGQPIGTSRFYGLDKETKTLVIGYTFIARDYWGKAYNRALKTMMLDHAFKTVDQVLFHIGATNTRSQIAIGKLGAIKTGEIEMEYYGEPNRLNFIYEIKKEDWAKTKAVFK